jgi:hypothetical protein
VHKQHGGYVACIPNVVNAPRWTNNRLERLMLSTICQYGLWHCPVSDLRYCAWVKTITHIVCWTHSALALNMFGIIFIYHPGHLYHILWHFNTSVFY